MRPMELLERVGNKLLEISGPLANARHNSIVRGLGGQASHAVCEAPDQVVLVAPTSEENEGSPRLKLVVDNDDMSDEQLLEKLGMTPEDVEQHILEICYLMDIPAPDGGEARPKNMTPEMKRLFHMRNDERLSEGWREQANEIYQSLRRPERADGDSING